MIKNDVQQGDGLGESQPEPREDALGEKTFGDDKADNAGDPKIVDYPENSEDITDDIEAGQPAVRSMQKS
jgi:hypothetical protein